MRTNHPANTNANIRATGGEEDGAVENRRVALEGGVAIHADVAELGDHTTTEIQTAFVRLRAAGTL